jgi:hypothetical protein
VIEEVRRTVRDGLGADAAVRLATMRAEVGLKLPGCCVLLAAQDASAQAILTFDDALTRAAERSGFETV